MGDLRPEYTNQRHGQTPTYLNDATFAMIRDRGPNDNSAGLPPWPQGGLQFQFGSANSSSADLQHFFGWASSAGQNYAAFPPMNQGDRQSTTPFMSLGPDFTEDFDGE